jgi:hypothetical protein
VENKSELLKIALNELSLSSFAPQLVMRWISAHFTEELLGPDYPASGKARRPV